MGILITKADGTQEEFAREKLIHSLRKAGAEGGTLDAIVTHIEAELKPLISTSEIYRHAFDLLRKEPKGVAARYSLKRAILELGPSGFPFEAYLAELFRAQGKEAVIDQIVKGVCVEHEVDVIFTDGKTKTYVEAKFHNAAGFKTDLKVVLYVKARIDDIQLARKEERVAGMIVTNTKFTTRAVAYASCEGLALIGWDYPVTGNLHDIIGETGLYPTTALTSLTRSEKNLLLAEKLVLCKSLPEQAQQMARAGIRPSKFGKIFAEVGALCGPKS